MGKQFYILLVIQAAAFISTFSLPVTHKVCPKIGKIYGLLPEDAGCCLNETDCRYQHLEPSQDVAERIQQLLAINNDDLDNNIELQPHGKRVHRNKRSTSHKGQEEHQLENIEVERDNVDLHKYLALCQTKTKVVQPVWATSADSDKAVQLIQLKPVLEQHIEMVYCEEKETFFLNGFCKQAHKRQEVYVVDAQRSSYNSVAVFRRDTIYVASGCKVLLNIEVIVEQITKYSQNLKNGHGSEGSEGHGLEGHGSAGHGSDKHKSKGDNLKSMDYVFMKKATTKHGSSDSSTHPEHSTTPKPHAMATMRYVTPYRYRQKMETGGKYDVTAEDEGGKGTTGKREARIDEDQTRMLEDGMTSESLTRRIESEKDNEIVDTVEASMITPTTLPTTLPLTRPTTTTSIPVTTTSLTTTTPTSTTTVTTTLPTTTTTVPTTTTTESTTISTTTPMPTAVTTPEPSTAIALKTIETTTPFKPYTEPIIPPTIEVTTAEPTVNYELSTTSTKLEGHNAGHHVTSDLRNYETRDPEESVSSVYSDASDLNGTLTTLNPGLDVHNSVYEEEHDSGFHGHDGEEGQEDTGTRELKYYPHIPEGATHPDRARRTEYGAPEHPGPGHGSGYGSDGAPPTYGLRYPGDSHQSPRMHQKPNKIGVPVYTKEGYPDSIRKYRQRQNPPGRQLPHH